MAEAPAPAPGPGPAPGKRRRGRPRIRTELELEQRRKAWYRQRYLRSVYLGQQSERWRRVRQQLGHGKDEQTARALLDCFTARSRGSCAGKVCSAENIDHLHTSCDSLRQLIVWSHDHSRDCGFIPNLKSILSGRAEESVTVVWTCAGGHSYSWEMLASRKGAEEGAGEQKQARPAAPNPGRSRRRVLSTLPANGKRTRLRAEKGSQDVSSDEREKEPSAAREEGAQAKEDGESATGHAGTSPAALTEDKPEAQEEAERPTQVAEGEGKAGENSSVERSSPEKPAPDPRLRPTSVEEEQEEAPPQRAETPGRLHRNSKKPGPVSAELEKADSLELVCEPESEGKAKQAGEPRVKEEEEEGSQESEEQVAETELLLTSEGDYVEDEEEEELTEVDSDDEYEFFDDPKDENYIPSSDSGSDRDKRRGRSRRNSLKKPPDEPVERKARKHREKRNPNERPQKIRKKLQKQYVRCEFDGCGKIVSNPQYLKRHIKYQHILQRSFACSYPTCGRIFRFKTQMEEHEKLHSDQRNYICEYCGRAFKTDKNLVVHRRIHTGEKPLQCEICGFTCRQKASLNWHMKKHDAESGYQFSCEICGKRFEKKDNVSAHKSKSHPETLVSVNNLEALEASGAFGVCSSFSESVYFMASCHLPGEGGLEGTSLAAEET